MRQLLLAPKLEIVVIPFPSLAAKIIEHYIGSGSGTCYHPFAVAVRNHPSFTCYPYLVLAFATAASFSLDPSNIDPSYLKIGLHTFTVDFAATSVTIQIDSGSTNNIVVTIDITDFGHHRLMNLQNRWSSFGFHRTFFYIFQKLFNKFIYTLF